VIVGGAFLVFLVAYGSQYAFGVFFAALLDEFGWSRAQLAGAFSLYTLVYCVAAFPAGRLTDRWGPRPVIAAGAVLLSGALAAMAVVTRLSPVALPARGERRPGRGGLRPDDAFRCRSGQERRRCRDGPSAVPPCLSALPKTHEQGHDAILKGPPRGSTRNADTGGVAERLKAPVLKTGIPAWDRGFESLPLRHRRPAEATPDGRVGLG
jgi:Major Facilitator Superfamily